MQRGIFIPIYPHTPTSEVQEIQADLKRIGLDDTRYVEIPEDARKHIEVGGTTFVPDAA